MPDKTLRDERLAFRLPTATATAWRAAAAAMGVSLSDFVRAAVDARAVSGLPAPARRSTQKRVQSDPELIRQLAAIGNNLNQIARSVNSNRDGIESIKLLAHLAAIQSQLEQIGTRDAH